MPRIRSLAVLPLANLSGDPEQEYFTDGMTEALIAELGQVGALKVISRTSAMQYRDTDWRLPQIARELEIDALIEGSVLKAGDEVRITLQLVHGATDRHLWAKSYKRELQDVLSLQSNVARAIADEVQVTLAPSVRERLKGATSAAGGEGPHPQAYEAYLKGRYHFNRLGGEASRTAIHHYEEAIARDSSFALAHAALAEVCLMPGILFEVRFLDECEQTALRALELDDELAEAHAALGNVKVLEWDWSGSEAEFRRAIDLNPNSVMAHQWYAQFLRETMRFDEALREARRAEELDPLNLFVKTMVGWPLFNQHRYDEAMAQWDEVLEMDPDYGLAIYNKGLAYAMMGMPEEVLESARRAAARLGENAANIRLLTAWGYAIAGQEDGALEILEEIERQHGDRSPFGFVGAVYLELGKEEVALRLLERGYRLRSPRLPIATSEPLWDALRDHPTFQEVRRKMGLP